ncbi:MAG: hypothetical protein QM727_15410 [Niabella sp.]
MVNITAYVTRAFNSSMEVHIEVWGEDLVKRERYKSNAAYYTFVALDIDGKPTNIPTLEPETDEEKKIYEGALHRRQLRLIFAGKMKPGDATELKELFADSVG